VIDETDTHAIIEELLEAVFSVRSVPRLYNEDQLPLPSQSREILQADCQLRSEKLIAEAGDSPGT
jgi:hypothetical protein